jgi:3-hydroxybutyryl-CoA dehydrogenase
MDTKSEFVESGLDHINKNVNMLAQKLVKKGKLDEAQAQQSVQDTLARISGTTLREDLADCDLVVEAIIENIDVKKELYTSLGSLCKPGRWM